MLTQMQRLERVANLKVKGTTEEVLQQAPIIDSAALQYRAARKTKPIRAKPMGDILVDSSVYEKFLLNTLEGYEVVRSSGLMCVGLRHGDPFADEADYVISKDHDVWQQNKDKLFKTYTIVGISDNGWMLCEPKPENVKEVAQIILDDPEACWSVENPWWGDRQQIGDETKYLQFGMSHDYLLRDPDNHEDTYRVEKSMFENTYEFI